MDNRSYFLTGTKTGDDDLLGHDNDGFTRFWAK
jgi:hypothetical protein